MTPAEARRLRELLEVPFPSKFALRDVLLSILAALETIETRP